MERVSILGVTGSVGRSTQDVIQRHRDRFAVEAVVGGRDAAALADAARALGARFAAVAEEASGPELAERLAGTGIATGAGEAAVREAAQRDCDVTVAAISGVAGLAPTAAALAPGRRLALANKESLVCAGQAFMEAARRNGVTILPVDSEHNALHQALQAGQAADVVSLTITASGGPFLTWPAERIARATPAEASAHPVWSMGTKINIDSATLMNKGLELIEAHHLFGVAPERIDAVVHPQSIIHGLVEWRDGSVTAGLATPDMRIPIANCLANGARLSVPARRLDLAAIARFTFEPPDLDRFPCLRLAKAALAAGGAQATILNAANEVGVAAFLAGSLSFPGIARLVEATLGRMTGWREAPGSVEEALTIDREARRIAEALRATVR